MERVTSSTGQSERGAMKNIILKWWELCGRAITFTKKDLRKLSCKR